MGEFVGAGGGYVNRDDVSSTLSPFMSYFSTVSECGEADSGRRPGGEDGLLLRVEDIAIVARYVMYGVCAVSGSFELTNCYCYSSGGG